MLLVDRVVLQVEGIHVDPGQEVGWHLVAFLECDLRANVDHS